MALQTISQPSELCILSSALDQYCEEIGIDESDAKIRKALARRVMHLSSNGVHSLKGLKEALRDYQSL